MTRVPIGIFLPLLLFFSTYEATAQPGIIDSVKNKSKSITNSIGGFIKKSTKGKTAKEESKSDNANTSKTTDGPDAGNLFKTNKINFSHKDLISSIEVPYHNGLPIVGTFPLSSYKTVANTEGLDKDLRIYRLLLEMNLDEAAYRIRKDPSLNTFNNPVHSSIINKNLIELLYNGVLRDEAWHTYFCADPGGTKGCYTQWGGQTNDAFYKQKRYQDFLSSGIYESLQKKANELPLQLYVYTPFTLGNYDFNKKAFPLQLSLRNGWTDLPEIRSAAFYLPMSPDEAESLRNRIRTKDNYGRDVYQLYALYKVQLIKSITATNRNLSYSPNDGTALMGYLPEPVITIYTDPALKNQLTGIDLHDRLLVSSTRSDLPGENTDNLLSVQTIKLNDPDLLDPKIIMYRNLPLLGGGEGNASKSIQPSVYSRLFLSEEKAADYELYHKLVELSFSRDSFKNRLSPFLTFEEKQKMPHQQVNQSNYLNRLIEDATQLLVSDKLYIQFFCDGSECSGSKREIPGMTFSKSTGNYGSNSKKSSVWGPASADAFAEREYYAKFQNSGVEKKLLSAATRVPRQAYMISSCVFKDYDFSREAFPVILYPQGPISASLGKFENGGREITLYYKVSADKAKVIQDRLSRKQEQNGTAVFKVNILPDPGTSHGGYQFRYEISSAEVDLYYDKSLYNKFTTVSLK